MSALTEKIFYSEAKRVMPAYQYGMLVVIVGLLAWNIVWLARLPPRYPHEHFSGLVCALMLLLNHLAFAFRWPRRARPVFRLAAFLWVIGGCWYVFSQ